MIRILIVDDHAVVRRGLALVLRQEPDFEVVGEAEDGQTAVSLTQTLHPHVVVMDWKMPHLSGIEAAKAIKQGNKKIQTLLLSGAAVETAVLDALESGVDGFVHKDITPAGLAHAIRTVASGRRYLGPEVTQALIARSRQPYTLSPEAIALSAREQEILALMATPATYRDMAAQLSLSEATIHTYVKRILSKLDQPNRTQAVIAALRLNLIALE
ncbi:MAG: response regulator transcription factor [Ardenticatenaceae bacterium]|nr:response regulator transcription factor [Ardenticatenaceae bacterium]